MAGGAVGTYSGGEIVRRKGRSIDERLKVALRKVFLMSALRREALKVAKVAIDLYVCTGCGVHLSGSECKVDHHLPVVDPQQGFVDWNTYIKRMFCDVSNLKILCDSCHKVKTKIEDGFRRLYGTGRYSVESRKKAADSKRGRSLNKGVKKSLAHRLAMSKERKDKPQTEARQKAVLKATALLQKPVLAKHTTGMKWAEFKSVQEASQKLKVPAYNISRVCNAKQGRKQAGGFEFKWAS